jgi:catechol 2,3-dioxygenase-like lactoylglutathione lyase family enzyme
MKSGSVVAILPCNNLDRSERFYRRLGFARIDGSVSKAFPTYRVLSNGNGLLHSTTTVEGWLTPGRNPFGLYFYMEDVDTWAKEFRDESLEKNQRKNHGVRMSLRCPIPTRRWFVSAGRCASAGPNDRR